MELKVQTPLVVQFEQRPDNPWWNWKFSEEIIRENGIDLDNPWWNWKIINFASKIFMEFGIILDGIESHFPQYVVCFQWVAFDNPWWNWKAEFSVSITLKVNG